MFFPCLEVLLKATQTPRNNFQLTWRTEHNEWEGKCGAVDDVLDDQLLLFVVADAFVAPLEALEAGFLQFLHSSVRRQLFVERREELLQLVVLQRCDRLHRRSDSRPGRNEVDVIQIILLEASLGDERDGRVGDFLDRHESATVGSVEDLVVQQHRDQAERHLRLNRLVEFRHDVEIWFRAEHGDISERELFGGADVGQVFVHHGFDESVVQRK